MDINDTTAEANVRDNPEAGRYEITREGRTAILAYRREAGAIALVHTFVPPPLRARGLAKRLVAFALADARRRRERPAPAHRRNSASSRRTAPPRPAGGPRLISPC